MKDINEAIKQEMILNFKTRNKLPSDLPDVKLEPLIKYYCDKCTQTILNLTNRLRFPSPLKYIVIELMTEFFDLDNAKNNETPSINTGNISSMSEDGRSINFEDKSKEYYTALINQHIQENTDFRKKEIYRYKLLYREVLKADEN